MNKINIMDKLSMVFRLPIQLQQFINLILLFIVGTYIGHIYLSWVEIFLILIFTLLIEHFFIYTKSKKITFVSYASLSTALGVMLMMLSTHFYIYVFVIVLGLAQKHFLRYKSQHFFNPSNFALMGGLLFFYYDTHIALGQLGENIIFQVLVLFLGLLILYRVNRWLLSVGFVISYVSLQYFLLLPSDPVLLFEDIYARFYSVSFIVFIVFMLTDPQTTPSSYVVQSIFAFTLALGATLLDYYFGFRVQHLFMLLFLCTPMYITLKILHKEKRTKKIYFYLGTLLLLTLSAIIYIEIQAPYYLEMYR
jgi:hypothetical protein